MQPEIKEDSLEDKGKKSNGGAMFHVKINIDLRV